MDDKQKCTCKWKSCKRHGKCEKCIEHHSKHPKYPLPFCKKQGKSPKTLPKKQDLKNKIYN